MFDVGFLVDRVFPSLNAGLWMSVKLIVPSAVFGLLVGLVGCSHGLQTGRTADAVGCAATAAVVGSLILITVFVGIFAVLFFLLGV